MSYEILNISKFSNSHSIFSSPSVSPASHAGYCSVYVLRIHSQPKRALPHYTPRAKVHLSSIIYHLCHRQNIHYSLNFARPLRPLRPDLIRTPFFLLFQANIIRRSLLPFSSSHSKIGARQFAPLRKSKISNIKSPIGFSRKM